MRLYGAVYFQTKSRNSDFNYSATLYFFQEYEDQYSIQQVYTVLQEMESTAATIIKDHLPGNARFFFISWFTNPPTVIL